jgi:NAD(P)-dependent dehydrogenase (short-subunit alcohol dehydrogenase family)
MKRMSSNAKDRVIRDGLAWIVGVGASRGTGAALARRFAAEGLTVAITGRSDDNVNIIVREIETTGGRAIAAPGDVSKEEDVLAVLKHLETIGPIKVGIYNAGNAVWGPPLEATTAEFESMWRIGCLGGFVFGREIARSMLPRGQGTILFTGASASLRGKAAFAAFAAAKAGLRIVSQSFAREFGPKGIHVVHVIIDGSINGEKINQRFPDMAERKGPDGLLVPEAIADVYWHVHSQHRSAWTQEIDVRPYAEAF